MLKLLTSYKNFACGLAVVYAVHVLGRYLWRRFSTPLPPGPLGLPLIGNILDLPKPKVLAGPFWAKHKSLYGPLSSVKVLTTTIVVLNDLELAVEMFEKRSTRYSDRPKLVFLGELCGISKTLSLTQYGERFRAIRKLFHQYLGSRAAVSQFTPVEELESRRFLLRTLRNPDSFRTHIRTMAGAIILKLAYGYTVQADGDDPLVTLMENVMKKAAGSGGWMVDKIPILKYLPEWLPGAGFKSVAKEWRIESSKTLNVPFAFAKEQLAAGRALSSFVSSNLEEMTSEYETEMLQWAAQDMYAGGADTTVSAFSSFFLAMIMYPEVLKRAQMEIDTVIGNDRLPSLNDRDNLPYIDAVLKETLRWNVVTPLGVPHVSAEDDIFRGYFIPKGAIIIANIWQFSHDPQIYHEADVFKPERFLSKEGYTPGLDPHMMAFGFGRRICPGKELADASMFVAIAMTIAVFDIVKVKDAEGNVIEPSCEYAGGTIVHPKEFPCQITPRSNKAISLIEAVEIDYPFEAGDAHKLRMPS